MAYLTRFDDRPFIQSTRRGKRVVNPPDTRTDRRVLLTRLAVVNSRITILETDRVAFFQREDTSPSTPWPAQTQLEALREQRAGLEARLRGA